jgi:hypothetical protein
VTTDRRTLIAVSIRAVLLAYGLVSGLLLPLSYEVHDAPLAPQIILGTVGVFVQFWLVMGFQLLLWRKRAPFLFRRPAFTAMPWSGLLNFFHLCGWFFIASATGIVLRHVFTKGWNLSGLIVMILIGPSLLIAVATFSAFVHRGEQR